MEKCFICYGREPESAENEYQDQDDITSISSSVTLSAEEIDYEKSICTKVLLKLLYLPEIPFEMLLKNESIIICNNCKKRLMVVDHVLSELEVLQGKIVVARRIIEKDLTMSYQQDDYNVSKNLRNFPGAVDINSACGVRKFICDLMHGLSTPILDKSLLGTIPVLKKQPCNVKKRRLSDDGVIDECDVFIEKEKLKTFERDPIENVTLLNEDCEYDSILNLNDLFGGSNIDPSRTTNINYGSIIQNINSTVRLSAPNGYTSPSISYRVDKDPVNNNNGGEGAKVFKPLMAHHLREKILSQSIQSQRPRSPMTVKESSILLDKDAFKKLIIDDAKEKKLKLHIHITSLPIVPREVKTVDMISNEKVNKFLTNENIKLHILQEERDIIHKTCRVCSKVFQTKTKCESHLNTIHLGIEERQFECTQLNCTRKFKQQFLLNQHIRVVHLGVGFKCTVENCPKVLSTRHNQIKHSMKCSIASAAGVQMPKINYQPSSNFVQQFQPDLPPIHYVHQINLPTTTTMQNLVDVSLLTDNIGDRNIPEEIQNDPLALF